LRALTRANMGLGLFHHPGKEQRPLGLAARGSSAFLGTSTFRPRCASPAATARPAVVSSADAHCRPNPAVAAAERP
jgi:hypothetical protein